MKTLEFLYQEKQIHFLLNPSDKNVMINATEMAKLFNKRTSNYLVNEKTKELIAKLELTRIPVNSNQKIIENRGHAGYYFNEILALDFAAWLDVDFKIWIYQKIRDIITQETKVVKSAVSVLTEKEVALKQMISQVNNSDNKEANDLLKAFSEYEEAKKNKTKAVSIFSKQISMSLS